MTYSPTTVVEVRAFDRTVGAIAASTSRRGYAFEYDPAWRRGGIELAPALMPVTSRNRVYVFPSLNPQTFQLLPPMIADALPDRFGNAVVNAYLARQGISAGDIT